MDEKLPKGFFADPKVRKKYLQNVRNKQRRSEKNLKESGIKVNEFDELICIKCDVQILPTESSDMGSYCPECGKLWNTDDEN